MGIRDIMMALSVLIAGFLIADAIMFVNGYRGYFWHAKTPLEKAVRKAFFEKMNVDLDKEEYKKNKEKL